jgi:hypothetical protein
MPEATTSSNNKYNAIPTTHHAITANIKIIGIFQELPATPSKKMALKSLFLALYFPHIEFLSHEQKFF